MRVALFSDTHGNYVSLEAVITDFQQYGVDAIVCLGDVAATGAQPKECVQRVQALGCPIVMGNTDAWLLEPKPTKNADEFTSQIEAIDIWCSEQLSQEEKAFMQTFVATYTLDLDEDTQLLCYHGSPRNHSEIINPDTPEDDLLEIFDGHDALVMVGGHTHNPMCRRLKDKVLVNGGSVGLPYEFKMSGEVRNPPWAEYVIIESQQGQLDITLRRIPVAINKIKAAIRTSGMPHTDLLLQDWR